MCGRIDAHDPIGVNNLVSILDIEIPPAHFPRRYNVSPGTDIATVRHAAGFEAVPMEWGIVPHWANPGQFDRPLINARAETIREKPTFKKLIQRTRVIIPVNGFYEWQRSKDGKTPYYFSAAEDDALALGGIYQVDHEGGRQCCIITTAANRMMAPVHDRMPLIIERDAMQDWLRSDDPGVVDALIRVCPDDALSMHRVSAYVNSTRNDSEKCIESV